MKIYEVKETGLRMRVPGCYECPNRTKTRWGDVCIAIPIKEKGKDTGFYKDIEPWAKDGIGPIDCPLDEEEGADDEDDYEPF